MILKTRYGGNVELRTEWGTEHIIPRHGASWVSDSGIPVTERDAYGLPAVSNVIRAPAEIIASLPFFVYRRGETKEPARDTWQWEILHDQPSEYCDTYRFFYDLVLSLEATQNAFVHKIRGIGSRRNRLEALEVLDPHRVKVTLDRKTGEKTFAIWIDDSKITEGLTTRDVLHFRGFTPSPGGAVGVSLIQVHTNALGTQTQMQRFEGDYFKANGIPPFWFTGAANAKHAQEIVGAYNQNRMQARSGQPGGLWGAIDVKSIPISMEDAKYAEVKGLSVDDVCRIWRWPRELLEVPTDLSQASELGWTSRMMKFYLLPRLSRIERAFAADEDIFPGHDLFGEFLTAALERADYVTRVRGYKDARQGGWVTTNEIRNLENLPPLPGGDELQQTPVGGAPNRASSEDSDDDD